MYFMDVKNWGCDLRGFGATSWNQVCTACMTYYDTFIMPKSID